MKLDVIDDFAELLRIRDEWSSFSRSIPGTTPFQAPAWLLTWWRCFGSGALRVAVIRNQGALFGIVPCFLHEWQGARQITLIGSGISDYLEPVFDPKYSSEVVSCLGKYLASESDWDLCNWQDLSFNTPLHRLAATDHGLRIKQLDEAECRRIHMHGSFDEYWGARSSSLRGNLRRDQKRAESIAGIKFGTTECADSGLIETLIRLHDARWQKRGQMGMIAANASTEFLREIAREFEGCHMLRIFWLSLDARIVAVILAFQYGSRIFDYLTAFDPLCEHLGVGRLLLFEALRDSFNRGYREWDFLRGNEPYKSWWGARQILKCRLMITRE